jgi:hypothetical protein
LIAIARVRTGLASGPGRAPFMKDFAVFHGIVALVALVGFAFAASACTAYKSRDTDPNAGGGSMYRAGESARTH